MARHRADEPDLPRVVVEHPADRPDGLRQRAVGDDDVGPDAVEDLLPRHRTVALLHQQQQQVEVPGMSATSCPSSHSTRRAGESTNRPKRYRTAQMLVEHRGPQPHLTSRSPAAEDFRTGSGYARASHPAHGTSARARGFPHVHISRPPICHLRHLRLRHAGLVHPGHVHGRPHRRVRLAPRPGGRAALGRRAPAGRARASGSNARGRSPNR